MKKTKKDKYIEFQSKDKSPFILNGELETNFLIGNGLVSTPIKLKNKCLALHNAFDWEIIDNPIKSGYSKLLVCKRKK